MNTIAVFVEKITPRKKFIINHILKNILKYECLLISEENIFRLFNGPRINYSMNRITNNELHIIPSGLLDENNIHPLNVEISEHNNIKIFFRNNNGDLCFDIFSASFFLITRYEEYYDNAIKDEFGRYDYKNSIAFKNNFLQVPIIEIWCNMLVDSLKSKFPYLEINQFSEEKYIFTFDVDNAYAFKFKGILKNLGATLKSILRKDFIMAFERYPVIFKLEKDPYDTYDYINQFKDKYEFDSVFFFLLRNKGKYDRAISASRIEIRKLIENISKKHSIGLHTSVYASDDLFKIVQEKSLLEDIIERKVTSNRFHYLKFSLPFSYRILIEAGILFDYSMGYHNITGFRAGTSIPFKFYDLHNDLETQLTVVPFSVMDITLLKYMKLDPQHSIKVMQKLIKVTLKNGGKFIPIWHNEFLSDFHIYRNWKIVFEEIIEFINNIDE